MTRKEYSITGPKGEVFKSHGITVGELVALLSKFDPKAEVFYRCIFESMDAGGPLCDSITVDEKFGTVFLNDVEIKLVDLAYGEENAREEARRRVQEEERCESCEKAVLELEKQIDALLS